MSYTVKVVVPIYRTELPAPEAAALKNNARQLHRYPIVLLAPEGLDISRVEALVPAASVLRVSDEWLGSKNGISGYNRMMLSAAFYRLFADVDYILICHTDAWIFRDELQAWCDRGFDCVAAPWIRRSVYNLPIIKQYMAWRLSRALRSGRPCRQMLYGRIGNGGLCLRRVSSFLSVSETSSEKIEKYLSVRHHLYNEDVFWALEPRGWQYPSEREALSFAFDVNPAYCYRYMDRTLPMGCHSWNKPRFYRFWRAFIPVSLD